MSFRGCEGQGHLTRAGASDREAGVIPAMCPLSCLLTANSCRPDLSLRQGLFSPAQVAFPKCQADIKLSREMRQSCFLLAGLGPTPEHPELMVVTGSLPLSQVHGLFSHW